MCLVHSPQLLPNLLRAAPLFGGPVWDPRPDSRRRTRSVCRNHSLHGERLVEADISARTDLNVVVTQVDGEIRTDLSGSTVLEPGVELLMLGSNQQRHEFSEVFGS